MKRRIAVILIILGVIAAVLGVLSATTWRASNVVTMESPRGQAPVAMTEAGVLEMMSGDVDVTATADADQPLTLVIEQTPQVEEWIGGSPHTRITGASDWETLATQEVALAEGGTETVPDPAQADGWQILEQGEGTVEIAWTPQEGAWSVLAVTDGEAPAPSVTLSWQRDVATPWLWPGVIVGALLILGGVILAVAGGRAGERRTGSRRAEGIDPEKTTVLPAVKAGGSSAAGGQAPNRRARREPEEGR